MRKPIQWEKAEYFFRKLSSSSGDSLLVKKSLITSAKITEVFYYYLFRNEDRIQRLLVRKRLSDRTLRFTYKLHPLQTIFEE